MKGKLIILTRQYYWQYVTLRGGDFVLEIWAIRILVDYVNALSKFASELQKKM